MKDFDMKLLEIKMIQVDKTGSHLEKWNLLPKAYETVDVSTLARYHPICSPSQTLVTLPSPPPPLFPLLVPLEPSPHTTHYSLPGVQTEIAHNRRRSNALRTALKWLPIFKETLYLLPLYSVSENCQKPEFRG